MVLLDGAMNELESDAGDREALAEVAIPNSHGLEKLLNRHGPALLRYLRTLLPASAAEDALQETFLAVFRGAQGFRGEGSVRGWLYTIARNTAFKLRRHQREEPKDLEDIDALGTAAGWGASERPDDLLSTQEQHQALATALTQLDPFDQEILVLRDMDGLSGEETAKILGIGLPAAKSRLHRARLKLIGALPR
jgi:RNA polymerase sigma-70 factor (ECF subfamily)